MRMRVGMGSPGKKPGQEIAIGKGSLLAKPNDDQIERRCRGHADSLPQPRSPTNRAKPGCVSHGWPPVASGHAENELSGPTYGAIPRGALLFFQPSGVSPKARRKRALKCCEELNPYCSAAEVMSIDGCDRQSRAASNLSCKW
jgi:hypothetical protein